MASQSLSDSTLISPIQRSFETPGQTKVSGNRQREATHEVCCYTSQFLGRGDPPRSPCSWVRRPWYVQWEQYVHRHRIEIFRESIVYLISSIIFSQEFFPYLLLTLNLVKIKNEYIQAVLCLHGSLTITYIFLLTWLFFQSLKKQLWGPSVLCTSEEYVTIEKVRHFVEKSSFIAIWFMLGLFKAYQQLLDKMRLSSTGIK